MFWLLNYVLCMSRELWLSFWKWFNGLIEFLLCSLELIYIFRFKSILLFWYFLMDYNFEKFEDRLLKNCDGELMCSGCVGSCW